MADREILKRIARRSGGYMMLLSMVVTMLIGLVFYIMYTNKGVDMDSGDVNKTPPWRIWTKNLIKLRDEPIGQPSEEQPKLDTALLYNSSVRDDSVEDLDDRGSVELVIMPDGTVTGGWSGHYWISRTLDHQIMTSSANGNIIPEEVYSDDDGEDPSKLYFITSGGFSILETNSDSGRVRNVMGDIYFTGWIDSEYNMEATVTITSDQRNFKAYDFEASAQR